MWSAPPGDRNARVQVCALAQVSRPSTDASPASCVRRQGRKLPPWWTYGEKKWNKGAPLSKSTGARAAGLPRGKKLTSWCNTQEVSTCGPTAHTPYTLPPASHGHAKRERTQYRCPALSTVGKRPRSLKIKSGRFPRFHISPCVRRSWRQCRCPQTATRSPWRARATSSSTRRPQEGMPGRSRRPRCCRLSLSRPASKRCDRCAARAPARRIGTERCRIGTVMSWIARRMNLLMHAVQGGRGRLS